MSSGAASPFLTTRWTLIAAAGQSATPESRRALSELCEAYWYPLYAYLRRKGMQPSEAQDTTQSFFAELLEKQRLQLADQRRGRFRAFLLTSLNHFVSNQNRHDRALKRGGAAKLLTLDFGEGEERYQREPTHELTPDRIFDRRWAVTLLDKTLNRLRDEYTSSGKVHLFDALKTHLGGLDDRVPYDQLASQLDSTVNALKVAAYRMRVRYRELLREEIAETVADPSEIDDELRDLFRAVSEN